LRSFVRSSIRRLGSCIKCIIVPSAFLAFPVLGWR
jgi:hypothetical protein